MSASDAAPLPRLGEVFFDVRGHSRTMRLSWYADTDVAVFSIWQGGKCTGTFRLPMSDLGRMTEILQRGPDRRQGRGTGGPGGAAERDSERLSSGPGRGADYEAQYKGGYDTENTMVHNAGAPNGAASGSGDYGGSPYGPPAAGGPQRFGADQLGADQLGAGEYEAPEYGAREGGTGPYGAAPYRTGDFSSRDSSRGQGPAEYGSDDYNAKEYGRGDYTSAPYGPGDYGARDDGAGDYGAGDYGARDYGAGDYGARDYGAGDYGARDYGSDYRSADYGGGPRDYRDPGHPDAGYRDHGTSRQRAGGYEPADYGRPEPSPRAQRPGLGPDDHYQADVTGQRPGPEDGGFGQERFVPPYVRPQPDPSAPGFPDDSEYRPPADPASRSRHSAGRHGGGQGR